jgi:Protein of unknown function (DUF2568)
VTSPEQIDLRGWRGVLLAAAFLVEIAMLVVLAVAGASLGMGMLAKIALAVLLPALVIAVWSLLLAPRARRRLADPARLLVKLAIFLGSAATLAAAGYVLTATAFAVVAVTVTLLAQVYAKGS